LKTKLTLRLEKEVIEMAKAYSSEKGESLSQLVEKFFKAVSSEKETDITPLVKELKGFIKDAQVDESDYKKFLEEKYL